MWNFLIPAGISAIGSIFGANAQNKATKEQVGVQREALQLEREKDRRSSESDMLRKLAQASYLRSGGAQTSPATVMMGGQSRQLPSFGFGPQAASPAQMSAAEELESLLLSRIGAHVPQSSLPAGTASSLNMLRGPMGGDSAAQAIEDFIRSRTGRAGY